MEKFNEPGAFFASLKAKIGALKSLLSAEQKESYQRYLDEQKKVFLQQFDTLTEYQKQVVDKLFR